MKKNKKANKKVSKNAKKGGFRWFLGISALSILILIGCQIFFDTALPADVSFDQNTKINGIDVSGMSVAEAENVVLTDMLQNKKDIEIELSCKDKTWTLSGEDFEVTNKITPAVKNFSKVGKEGNVFQKMINQNKNKDKEKNYQISYTNILANVDEKLDEIIGQVEQEAKPASLIFTPDGEEDFAVYEGQNALIVNRDKLYKEIDNALKVSKKAKIEIPIFEYEQSVDAEKLKASVGKRSEFSTSYANSSKARKNNVKKAITSFNGMIVQPGQVVSFNETTGPRTAEAGYQNANIIVGGVYVEGVGGGVCQASTTLYNALILADVDVLSVNHHTLPASYVPLSFDAMVSGQYSDLVFKNNLDAPIYIKTTADDKQIKVEIFGEKLGEGVSIARRAELVKILPHNGDKIVPDTKGEYSNKILYKGEYLRVKYPREGYETKGYLQFYKDGELQSEKEIRHDFYPAQDGIVMEGVEDPAVGMTIPASDVRIVKPQKVTQASENDVRNKLEKTNPSQFNP